MSILNVKMDLALDKIYLGNLILNDKKNCRDIIIQKDMSHALISTAMRDNAHLYPFVKCDQGSQLKSPIKYVGIPYLQKNTKRSDVIQQTREKKYQADVK